LLYKENFPNLQNSVAGDLKQLTGDCFTKETTKENKYEEIFLRVNVYHKSGS
jgi:hypothetical protein